jgi:hypothetical protein
MQYDGRGPPKSSTSERRAVALRNVERSGVHMKMHSNVAQFFEDGDPGRVNWPTSESEALRRRLHEHYHKHDGENKDFKAEGILPTSHCAVASVDELRRCEPRHIPNIMNWASPLEVGLLTHELGPSSLYRIITTREKLTVLGPKSRCAASCRAPKS